MNNNHRYILLGSPIPLARARFTNRRVYDSQKHLKLVSAIELERQHGDKPRFTGPLRMTVWFYLPIPKSMSKRKRYNMKKTPHYTRPDLSNLIKFIEDVATGILYKDDCIIAELVSYKQYDTDPRTEFMFSPLR